MGIYAHGERVRTTADYVAALAGDIGIVTNVIDNAPLTVYCVHFDRSGDTGLLPERLLDRVTTE